MSEDKQNNNLEESIQKIEKSPEFSKLPPQVKALIKSSLEQAAKIPIPIVTFRENDWTIATSPVFDFLGAQGKTEEEAIEFLKAMIDDYLTDPDTEKPTVKTIVNMEVGIKTISMNMPMEKLERVDNYSGKDTPFAAQPSH